MFKGLAYLHSLGICHRDIKPQNILIDPKTHIIKICDFGSAKRLSPDEPNVSYICSRYYRAPELIFGATHYTVAVDVWSTACVVAEMLTGNSLFPGANNVDQMVEIIKVLGTPTAEEVLRGAELARDISERTGIPVLCHTAEERLIPELTALEEPIFPITIQMKKPWER